MIATYESLTPEQTKLVRRAEWGLEIMNPRDPGHRLDAVTSIEHLVAISLSNNINAGDKEKLAKLRISLKQRVALLS